jgi:hypothetical protein
MVKEGEPENGKPLSTSIEALKGHKDITQKERGKR